VNGIPLVAAAFMPLAIAHWLMDGASVVLPLLQH
jgi:hypothetical protein